MTNDELLTTVSETLLDLGGAQMNVIRFGRGKQVLSIIAGVSLCGLEGQGAGVAQAYADFAEDYTVYLFDRRRVLPAGFAVQDMAEDVVRALGILNVEKTVVYGVSQGGMIALCIAIAHPELVRRMALCSTQARAGKVMRAQTERWQELACARDVVGLNRCFFQSVYSQAYLDRFREVLPQLEKVGTPADCARFEVLAAACETFDVYDRLTEIRCPVLVLGDENDQVISIDSSREIAHALGCELQVYDRYSHAVYDEAPELKERLRAFLG